MKTVRELINQAYEDAEIRGFGDTADENEVSKALERLNDILDELVGTPEFVPGKKFVDVAIGPEGYVTFSDDAHRIVTTAVIGPENRISTEDVHNLSDGDAINLYLEGRGTFDVTVDEVIDAYSFSVTGIDGIAGTFHGRFKKASEGPEFNIGVVDIPPTDIFEVVNENGEIMIPLEERDFYARKGDDSFDWWFYDKSPRPYPKLWVGGQKKVRVVYAEPFWGNLKLDMDLSRMPKVAYQAIKALLTARLTKYDSIQLKYETKFRKLYADYARAQHQIGTPYPDTSAPGYRQTGSYNIETDGFGNGRIF